MMLIINTREIEALGKKIINKYIISWEVESPYEDKAWAQAKSTLEAYRGSDSQTRRLFEERGILLEKWHYYVGFVFLLQG